MSEDLAPYRGPWTDEDVAALEGAAAWLREEVVALELEVACLEAELRDFRARRAHALARLYARLDALDAAIARELLARRPEDDVLRERARVTRAQAAESAAHAASLRDPPPPRSPASDELRRAYHQAARRMHPDLGPAAEQAERHRCMVLLNEAYERRDLRAIADLLEEWESARIVVGVAGIEQRRAYAQRSVQRLRASRDRLAVRLAELRASPEHRLMGVLRIDGSGGAARYDELVADLQQRITAARVRLDMLRGKKGGGA